MENKTALEKVNFFIKKNKDNKSINIVLTILFGLTIFIFGGLPAYSSLIRQQQDNQIRLKYIAEQNKKLNSLKKIQDELNTLSNESKFFNKIFPNSINQDIVIDELIETLNKYNLSILNINFAVSDRTNIFTGGVLFDSNVNELKTSMILRGQRSDILSFISDIEESRRVYNLTNLYIIKSDPQNVNDKNFNATIGGSFYFWKSDII